MRLAVAVTCVLLFTAYRRAAAESHTVSLQQLTSKVSPEAGRLLKRGLKAYEKRDLATATQLLVQAAELQPTSARLALLAGVFSFDNRDLERAAALLERAASLDPHDAKILAFAAISHAAILEIPMAIRYARRSLEIDPTDLRGHYVLGLSLATLGQELPAAARHLELSVDFNKDTLLYLTWVYTRIGDDTRAADACRRYLAMDEPAVTCLQVLLGPNIYKSAAVATR